MNGQIVLNINGSNVTVMGGAYREKPEWLAGVKLAEEIDLPCDVDLPIADFSVPEFKDTQTALAKTIALLNKRTTVYVGCMGGFGRTGMFIALLTKFSAIQTVRGGMEDITADVMMQFNYPVEWVRENYHLHAVETNEQNNFITDFDFRLLLAVAKFL